MKLSHYIKNKENNIINEIIDDILEKTKNIVKEISPQDHLFNMKIRSQIIKLQDQIEKLRKQIKRD
jgi:hypothetical protein